MKNITEYLELATSKNESKYVFRDISESLTYSDFVNKAKRIASGLCLFGVEKKPIAIYMNRGVKGLVAMFASMYAGAYYVIIDSTMPIDRIQKIFDVLRPSIIITEEILCCEAIKINTEAKLVKYDVIIESSINQFELDSIRSNMISTDPLYVLFTSGSTGVPKGTVLTHQNVINYTDWFIKTFEITSETVFGNQTPFYFSMSVSDIFSTIRTGATLNVIPKQLFSFPIKLIEFMDTRDVNTIYWVPSALCIIANINLFEYAVPHCLKKVLFAGEVMPTKQLNYWIKFLPDCVYANLFGPTEATDICTYYIVNRKFKDNETLPIGKPCDNCDAFLINDKGCLAKKGQEGELLIRGSFLASGYFNDIEKTRSVFIQNPLHNNYPEIVYKTGDICKYNDNDELMFISRKDFQIKHMGYRIELGEIEANCNSIDSVRACACLYNTKKDHLYLFYEGTVKENELLTKMKEKLPNYMVPNKIIKTKQMPYNANGKIDRKYLNEQI